jgi:hypothetical protein
MMTPEWRALEQLAAARNEGFSLALEMLAHFYNEYEYGADCYEEPDDRDGYLGKAVALSGDAEDSISKLLNECFPRSAEAIRKIDPSTWGDRLDTLLNDQRRASPNPA